MPVIPLLVVLPLIFAVLCVLVRERWVMRVAFGGHIVMLTIVVRLVADIVADGPLRYAVGGWNAPLGIELYADGLSTLMIAMTAVIGTGIGVYAIDYFRDRSGVRSFWPLWWLLWSAMNAAFLAADVFTIYVTLELIGLAAVGLVTLARNAVALSAALRYLLAALLGSLAYLLGVAILYGAHGTLAIADLATRIEPQLSTNLALALMSVGLLIKSALFPLHFWLPPAHGSALTPVSALLSALVVKASFYLLLRLWTDLFGATIALPAAQLIGAFGAAAIVWGSLAALRARRLKMLVAYSTVAQLGYLFLLFPMITATDTSAATQAWQGGVLYALAHGFAKAAMFLAAGAIVHAWGDDNIDHLEGTSARLPLCLFAFALAGTTLMGLPPSGGFIAKWLLLRSAFESAQWWWIIVLLAGGLMTAFYVFRVVRSAFVPASASRELKPIPLSMQWAALVLALISVALGLTATVSLALLNVGAPFAELPL